MDTAKDITSRRREFILRELEANREVSFAVIREHFPEAAERASIHGDVTAMRKSGIPATVVGGKKERRIKSENSRGLTKKAYREDWQTTQKEKIAQVVAGLIFGNTKPVKCEEIGPRGDEPSTYVSYAITRDIIINYLQKWTDDKTHPHFAEVMSKMRQFWACHDKTIALDSGTTADHVAEKIRHFDFARHLDGLNNLTLFTNSRSVFMKTGAPECNIKTIIIGGRQRHQTESICGELARRCLAAWDVSFGMTIVGATGIDASTGVMGSYNDEEAAMKQELLSRAKLRVIVADSTKFDRHSFKIISKFARMHPSSIDLIVTDSRPPTEAIQPLISGISSTKEAFDAETWQSRLPVPILVADDLIKLTRSE